MAQVDQSTLRRTMKLGLTAHDPERTCPGFVLYSPMFSDGEMYLIDMEGNEVRTLEMPYPPGLWGYVLPNGNLFYGGKLKQDETWAAASWTWTWRAGLPSRRVTTGWTPNTALAMKTPPAGSWTWTWKAGTST